MLKRLRDNEDGFTLIELLVVVIIIGILAAIAIPTFLNQRERGWQAELTSAVRNTALEAEAAATQHGGLYSHADVALAVTAAWTALGNPPIAPGASTFNANNFTICASHTQITGVNRVQYISATGGLQDFAEAACP